MGDTGCTRGQTSPSAADMVVGLDGYQQPILHPRYAAIALALVVVVAAV